jgi:hypothetical protein
MKSSSSFVLIAVAAASFAFGSTAFAASIDMNDPRRALGREDDIRVDAQISQDTVSTGSSIGVTYQVQNLTASPIAVAPRATDLSYDADSATITISLGAEVPVGGLMPQLTIIGPNEKKTFTGSASFNVPAAAMRAPFGNVPRYVVVRVNVLRDIAAFRDVANLPVTNPPRPMSDAQFASWLENNDAIYLNAVPVRWSPRSVNPGSAADSDVPSSMASAR